MISIKSADGLGQPFGLAVGGDGLVGDGGDGDGLVGDGGDGDSPVGGGTVGGGAVGVLVHDGFVETKGLLLNSRAVPVANWTQLAFPQVPVPLNTPAGILLLRIETCPP
jgi:hypothetical protein